MSKDTFETFMEDFRNLAELVEAFTKKAEAKAAELTDVEKGMFDCGFGKLIEKMDELHNMMRGGF